jgi:hypothetical protein
MVKRALEMEGTCTGEHSIGWGKKEALVWEVGHDTLGVMVSREFTLGLQSANTTTESDQGRVGPQMDHVGHAPIHCQ